VAASGGTVRVVTVALLVSWIVAVVFTPCIGVALLKEHKVDSRTSAGSRPPSFAARSMTCPTVTVAPATPCPVASTMARSGSARRSESAQRAAAAA